MTNNERVSLFISAIAAVDKLEKQYPNHPPFLSIHNQLQFLLDQMRGNSIDRARTTTINIGQLTVHEVEPVNDTAANLFYLVSAEVKQILLESESQ
jgi:hypothetical protein